MKIKELEKDNFLFIVIIGVWVILLLHFDSQILVYLKYQESVLAKLSIISFLACINLFWLYGIYHILMSLFSILFSKPIRLPSSLNKEFPPIAILYLTMNDFKKESLLSCINQNYPNFDVFVLDDSTEREKILEIDNLVRNLTPKVTVIRRDVRTDYKAGNLNNALSQIQSRYPYFAVCDADGILPADFLNKLIPYFSLDESIAFLQANQRSNPIQNSTFAKNLAFNTDVHWKYYVPAKNKYGFLMFCGHGAVIKTDIWKEVGGFPKNVTEDIVFTSLLREKGYRGIFVEDVVCYEDFPRDYLKFRSRTKRWITGTAEYLLKWYPKLLISKKVPWCEKLDILISAGVLMLSTPFLFFLFIVGVALPFTAKNFSLHIPLMANFKLLSETAQPYIFSLKYYVNWAKDFYLVMVIAAFAQLSPLVIDFWKKPLKIINYAVQFTFICLATILAFSKDLIIFLLTGRTYFPVTGEKLGRNIKQLILFGFLEMLLSVALFLITFQTGNVWLIPVSFALFFSPFLYFSELQLAVSIFAYIPFIFTLISLLLMSRSLF